MFAGVLISVYFYFGKLSRKTGLGAASTRSVGLSGEDFSGSVRRCSNQPQSSRLRQFETEPAAAMTTDVVAISGTGEEALALPIGCSLTITGGEIRNAELQVTSDGELIVTGTAIYVDGTAVSIATGGSFTVSTSQLIHN
eukprot:SAG31_NODE_155_length_22130_cov_9.540098_11_plen_140_part_00